jgi:hypothetical protein
VRESELLSCKICFYVAVCMDDFTVFIDTCIFSQCHSLAAD